MEEMTFREFVQEIGKGLRSLPGYLYKLFLRPKPLGDWIVIVTITILVATFVVGMLLAVLK